MPYFRQKLAVDGQILKQAEDPSHEVLVHIVPNFIGCIYLKSSNCRESFGIHRFGGFEMGISQQIIQIYPNFNGIFHSKPRSPSILGIPHLWKSLFLDLEMRCKSILGLIQALEIGCGWGRAKPQRQLFRELSHPTKDRPYMGQQKINRSSTKPGFLLFLGKGLENLLGNLGVRPLQLPCQQGRKGHRRRPCSSLESPLTLAGTV